RPHGDLRRHHQLHHRGVQRRRGLAVLHARSGEHLVSGEHDWLLLAPWYRWGRQDVPPRETRPELQKYETSDLVNVFLRDPQRSLKYGDEDLVATLTSPPSDGGLKRRLAGPVLSRTKTRKLFLDIHKRFYLVVCELHCDAPGLPNARADDVCEAGLV